MNANTTVYNDYTSIVSGTWQDAVICFFIIILISAICAYLVVLYIFGCKDE